MAPKIVLKPMLSLLLVILMPADSHAEELQLRLMTMNTWFSGLFTYSGNQKISEHIAALNPDIVVLQEVVSDFVFRKIRFALGGHWNGVILGKTMLPDLAILSPHPIQSKTYSVERCAFGTIVSITKDSTVIDIMVWNLHLNYLNYGPYFACANSTDEEILALEYIEAGDEISRMECVQTMMKNPAFQEFLQANSTLIVAGDFNTPSHQDWIGTTADAHCGRVIEWPITKMLTEAGFTDSFREVHPDPAVDPGITWSTVMWFEPQDRIDMMFHKGPIRAVSSKTYSGTDTLKPYPFHYFNKYPSDHYAVITDYLIDV